MPSYYFGRKHKSTEERNEEMKKVFAILIKKKMNIYVAPLMKEQL